MLPLQIDFKPSRILRIAVIALTMGAGAILILLELRWQIKLFLLIMLSASVVYTWRWGWLNLPWSIVALSISRQHELTVHQRDGKVLEDVQVLESSVVHPYLVVIHYRHGKHGFLAGIGVKQLLILPDALGADEFRRLRVWLLWGRRRDSLRKEKTLAATVE
ncbi:MAG: hypothetical protein FJY53_06015 [Betaproteobacteria bacterium]|nr:hypothetical protein [Betaproteobacteria bacterium]